MLGIDEFSAWHERLIVPLRAAFQTSGVFYFAWVIPYGLVGGLLGAGLIPLLKRTPPRVRWYIVLAGGIYISGAIGLEMLGGWYYEQVSDPRAAVWILLTTVEELLEMVGLSILTYALVTMLVDRHGMVSLLVTGQGIEASADTIADRQARSHQFGSR